MAISRHAFLRGQFSSVEPGGSVLLIDECCLSLAGIVCRVCQDFCDPDAIRFRPLGQGRSEPQVDLERCTLCLACAEACPVAAVHVSEVAA
ncbi:MAG: 4Fe-4S dicluster domain-containing protein [Geminicoccaceae bacterium]